MSNVHIDYFKANYVSDGKTGHLEINDNGEYTYEKINEEKLLALTNPYDRVNCNSKNLLETLKEEFPLDEEAPKRGKTLKNKKGKKANSKEKKSTSKDKKSKSKKGNNKNSRKSKSLVDSIRNVFQ
jgi:hypothetical protein